MNFPMNIHSEQHQNDIKVIMQYIVEYIEERQNSFHQRLPYKYEHTDNFIKIIYKEKNSEKLKEIELNLCSSEHILTYADLIKRTEILLHLPYVDKHYLSKESKDLRFYEGDVYHSKDEYWGNKDSRIV